MKELSITQKACRYDEAIERAKRMFSDKEIDYLFPELAESEDERIRESIIDFFKNYAEHGTWKRIPDVTKWIAWLEKQGEQKFVDKVEKAMNDAGYVLDDEKKEVRKVVQKSTDLPKGEDYGIDGLDNAIRILEKTLGKVEGYQTDDGILEHKCAISAVKNLYEQKPTQETWSEEDEHTMSKLLSLLLTNHPEMWAMFGNWLKCLKERYTWKPSEEQLIQLSNASNGLYYNCETLLSLLEQLKKLREE